MSDNVTENFTIKLNIDTSKAEKKIKSIEVKAKKLGENTSEEISNALNNIFDNLEEHIKKVENPLKVLSKTFEKTFDTIFYKFAGYKDLFGLGSKYIKDSLEKQWFETSNIRRTTSNARANLISDSLLTPTVTERSYLNKLNLPNNYLYGDRSNQTRNDYKIDRKIFDEHNYLPFTRRYNIATRINKYNQEDYDIVNEFMIALNTFKGNFSIITQEIGQKLLPVLTKLINNFNQLFESSNAFRKALISTFVALQALKGLKVLNSIIPVAAAIANPKTLAVILASLSAAGIGYAGKKLYDKINKKHLIKDNDIIYNYENNELGNLSPYKSLNVNNSYSKNGAVSYNIGNVVIKSDAKNTVSLIEDIRKNTYNTNNNYNFLMNNGNFGGLY